MRNTNDKNTSIERGNTQVLQEHHEYDTTMSPAEENEHTSHESQGTAPGGGTAEDLLHKYDTTMSPAE